jgi:hypothetical protein
LAVAAAVPPVAMRSSTMRTLSSGCERVLVDLQLVGAVLEGIGLAEDGAGKLSGLACGHEACAEPIGDGRAHEEPARLGAHDLGDARLEEVVGDGVDRRREALFVGEQGRDVLEDDPRLGIVGDVDDEVLVLEVRHVCSFRIG